MTLTKKGLFSFMKKILSLVSVFAATAGFMLGSGLATASDHDDITPPGTQTTAPNLTDLYVFRKGEEQGTATTGDPNTLVFIMNSYDRLPAREEAFFNTSARYEFHLSRIEGSTPSTTTPTAADDAVLRFKFSNPNSNGQQRMTLTYIADGEETVVRDTLTDGDILTTPLLDKGTGSTGTIANDVDINGQTVKVFAGLRQDPFYFDVDKFFALRADIANGDGAITDIFGTDETAVDFTRGFNVLSVVVEVPRALLQGNGSATTFDVWETISIPE